MKKAKLPSGDLSIHSENDLIQTCLHKPCGHVIILADRREFMELLIRRFDELENRQLYEILKVRSEVFVVEQTCVYLDIDGIDPGAVHIFYEDEGKIYGYLRVFWKDAETAQIGRVLSKERGRGFGYKVLQEGVKYAVEVMKAEKIYLEAQTYAIGFYQKAGFEAVSEEFLEDGIPHVKMIRLTAPEELKKI